MRRETPEERGKRLFKDAVRWTRDNLDPEVGMNPRYVAWAFRVDLETAIAVVAEASRVPEATVRASAAPETDDAGPGRNTATPWTQGDQEPASKPRPVVRRGGPAPRCPRCGGSTVRDGDELWCAGCGSQPTPAEQERTEKVIEGLSEEPQYAVRAPGERRRGARHGALRL